MSVQAATNVCSHVKGQANYLHPKAKVRPNYHLSKAKVRPITSSPKALDNCIYELTNGIYR